MSIQKEKTLKRMIQSVPLDIPPAGFTQKIMMDVLAEASDEVAISPSLKPLLRRMPLDIPPGGFDTTVMQQVRQARDQRITRPLISANDWLRFISGAAVFIVLILLFAPDSITNSIFSQVAQRIRGVVRMTSVLYSLTFICTSVLFILDHGLRPRLLRK